VFGKSQCVPPLWLADERSRIEFETLKKQSYLRNIKTAIYYAVQTFRT
jgi:hypothetical protein